MQHLFNFFLWFFFTLLNVSIHKSLHQFIKFDLYNKEYYLFQIKYEVEMDHP